MINDGIDEIDMYYDADKTEQIGTSLDFGVLPAGQTTEKSIYVENKIKFKVNLDISVMAEDTELATGVGSIKPNSTEKLTFKLSPKMSKLRPIKGKLKINLSYVKE